MVRLPPLSSLLFRSWRWHRATGSVSGTNHVERVHEGGDGTGSRAIGVYLDAGDLQPGRTKRYRKADQDRPAVGITRPVVGPFILLVRGFPPWLIPRFAELSISLPFLIRSYFLVFSLLPSGANVVTDHAFTDPASGFSPSAAGLMTPLAEISLVFDPNTSAAAIAFDAASTDRIVIDVRSASR